MLWSFIVGLVVGWIANMVIQGGRYGLIVNLLVGLVGALCGGWIVSLFGSVSIFVHLLASIIGAVLLLWLVTLLMQREQNSNKKGESQM